MRTFSSGACGLVLSLSLLSLGGCALVDGLETGDGSAEPAIGAARQAEPAVPAVPTYTDAELAPITNPTPAVIRGVQSALNEVGFPVGRPDGKMGKRTRHGLRLFKVARRMPVSDAITPALLAALSVPRD